MDSKTNDRRGFLHGMLAAGSLAAAAPAAAQTQAAGGAAGDMPFLPAYTRARSYKSLKQSSFDRTGGNSDRWPIAAGGVQEVFNATGSTSTRSTGRARRACRWRRRDRSSIRTES